MRPSAIAHGVIHDLESARSLSDLADSILIVSDRTLYVINNLLGQDAAFYSRWASAWALGLYEPVQPDTDDSALVDAIVDQARVDVMPINPDLVDVLQQLVTAIGNAPGTSVTCSSGGSACEPIVNVSGVAPCLANVAPADMVDQAGIDDVEPGTPPDGFATWGEYEAYKCAAAWTLVRSIESVCDNLASVGTAGATMAGAQTGLLLGLVAVGVAFPPALIVECLAAIAGIFLLSDAAGFVFKQIADYFRTNESDLVCQLYASGTAADAIDAIADFTEDAIQSVSWGALSGLSGQLGTLVGTSLSIVQSNTFVNPLFRLVTDIIATGESCQCAGGCGVFLARGTFDGGEYIAELIDGAYYIDAEFNSTAHLETCGDAATIVDVTLLSGTLTNAGVPIWRLYNNAMTDLQHGDSEPTWPVSGCRDITITSTQAFSVSIDWF